MAFSITAASSRSLSSVVLRNIAASGLARGGAILLDGLAYVLVARGLGPAEYGHYVSILAFLLLIDFAADLTLLDITVREISEKPSETGVCVTAATILRLALVVLGLVTYAVYIYCDPHQLSPELLSAAWLAALILPAGVLRMPLVVFRARLAMHYELAITLLTRLVNLLVVLAVIYFQGQLLHFFLAVIASRTLLGILSWVLAVAAFQLRPAFSLKVVKHLFLESIPMALSGLLVAVQLKVDVLLVIAISGSLAGGVYAVVAQLPDYFLYLPVIISTPLLPLLSQLYAAGEHENFQRYYQKLFDTLMIFIIPVIVVVLSMPELLIKLLFGPAYGAASQVLPFLIFSIAFMWFSHATAIAAVATKLQRNFIWIQAICVTAYLGLNLLLIPRWSAQGAATARLAGTVIAPFLTYYVIKRQTGFGLQFNTLFGILFAALMMTAAVLLMIRFNPAAAVLCGVVLYLTTLWTVRSTTWLPFNARKVTYD